MRYRFASFELDEARFELRREGRPVALQPKPLELLLHLARVQPATATREELFEALWPGTIVSESSLTTVVRALREALGESASESVVRTVRGRGYGLGVEVERLDPPEGGPPRETAASGGRAISHTAPTGLAPEPERSAFFGRSVELEQARRVLDSSIAGQFEILLFAGEPGIGKTRLAEEIVYEAARQDVRVVWGRAHEGAGQPAFWPWARVMRALTHEAEDLETLGVNEDAARDIATLLPELSERLSLEPSDASLGPAEARYRLFESVTHFLRAQAERQALAVVLDDLQWADASSLELLTFFAHELGPAPLLLIATYRDVELFPHAELEAALASLARAPRSSHTLALGGLQPEDITKMVAHEIAESSAGAGDAGRDWADDLFERTRGNPFFAREVLQLMAGPGALEAAAPIPPGVQSVLRRRLAGLEASARSLLSAAAVVGRDFRLEVLARVLGCSTRELLGAIEGPERARIVEPVPGTSGSFRFCHPLVQETLYTDLSARERVELHAQTADALERLAGDRIEPFLTRITHHLAAAQPTVDAERALDFAVRAAEYELRLLAFEDAVRSFERALGMIEDSGALEASRGNVLERLALARSRAGQPEAAADAWWQMLAFARGAQDSKAVARAAVGISSSVVFTAHAREDVTAVVREALDTLGETAPSLRARLLSALARQLTWSPEWRQQLPLCAEAVEQARASGDREALIEVSSQRAALLELYGEDETRVANYEELEALSQKGRDRETFARAKTLLLQHRIERGDGPGVDEDVLAYEKLASELRHPDFRIFCARVHAMRAIWRGELVRAERLVQDAHSLGQKVDVQHAGLVFSAQLGALRRLQGRLGELEAALRSAGEEHAMMVIFRCALLGMLVDEGRQDEAREVFSALAHDGFAALRPGDPNYWLCLALTAESCSRLGEIHHAGELLDRLAPRAGRCITVPHVVTAGAAERYAGLLLALQGELDPAIASLDRAIAFERGMLAPAWLSAALLDGAFARVLRDADGDARTARAAVAEAAGIIEELGLDGQRGRLAEVAAVI